MKCFDCGSKDVVYTHKICLCLDCHKNRENAHFYCNPMVVTIMGYYLMLNWIKKKLRGWKNEAN